MAYEDCIRLIFHLQSFAYLSLSLSINDKRQLTVLRLAIAVFVLAYRPIEFLNTAR